MVCRLLITIVAGTMLCSPPIIAQTFRAGVEVVELDFLALDKKGSPHPDLQPGDLRLLVAGKPRAIVSLTFIRSASSPVIADAARSDPASRGAPGGRTFNLIIADETIRHGDERPVIEGLARLVHALPDGDRVTIFVVPNRGVVVTATRDREQVVAALNGIRGHATEAFPFMRRQALIELGDAIRNTQQRSDQNIVVIVSGGILAPSAAMLLRGRLKALGVQGYELPDTADFLEIGRSAAEARAHTYVIQPANMGADASVGRTPNGEMADLGLAGLNDLTGVTGGDFFQMSGRNDAVFDRISRETSAYYLATFNVEEADRTGKPRKIELKATRPGITIRARPTFEVPRRQPILPSAFFLLPSAFFLLPSSFFLLP